MFDRSIGTNCGVVVGCQWTDDWQQRNDHYFSYMVDLTRGLICYYMSNSGQINLVLGLSFTVSSNLHKT